MATSFLLLLGRNTGFYHFAHFLGFAHPCEARAGKLAQFQTFPSKLLQHTWLARTEVSSSTSGRNWNNWKAILILTHCWSIPLLFSLTSSPTLVRIHLLLRPRQMLTVSMSSILVWMLQRCAFLTAPSSSFYFLCSILSPRGEEECMRRVLVMLHLAHLILLQYCHHPIAHKAHNFHVMSFGVL